MVSLRQTSENHSAHPYIPPFGIYFGRYYAYYADMFAIGFIWISDGRYPHNPGQTLWTFQSISAHFICHDYVVLPRAPAENGPHRVIQLL